MFYQFVKLLNVMISPSLSLVQIYKTQSYLIATQAYKTML